MLKDGTVHLIDSDPLGHGANGLAFSPDERYLYVGAGPTIFRYEPQPDGTLTNRQVLVDMSREGAPGGVDGMKVNRNGDIFTVGPRGVWVVTPDGRHIGTITFPSRDQSRVRRCRWQDDLFHGTTRPVFRCASR